MNPVWLASFPRSGNTFLRTILWNCFGLRSASVYPDDLGENSTIDAAVGHIELSKGQTFNPGEPALIKTHNPPPEHTGKVIYIVRDGREAISSLYHFYNKKVSLKDIIEGHHRFATWTTHIAVWNPFERPNSLLLRYENMVTSLPRTLEALGEFIGKPVLSETLPSRQSLASVDGKWIRSGSQWSETLKAQDLKLFDQVNGKMMEHLGYY